MAQIKGGYLLPAVNYRVTDTHQGHRNRKPPSQEPGTDYGLAYGSALRAVEDGVVVDVKYSTSGATGRYVTIDLADGRRVRFLHLSRVLVKVGDRVSRGQEVAKSGASANGREWGIGAHVHVSLWDSQRYVFGPNGTMDFEPQVGADNDGIPYDQTTADRQNFLKAARGERDLVVDGRQGGATTLAYKRYQTYLKSRGWYAGVVDGVWGPNTQAGHEKFYAEWSRPAVKPAATVPRPVVATVAHLGTLGNVEGLQKVARLYGYDRGIDNKWGDGSRAGLQRFLNQNHGGSLAAWLRDKHGYRDRDDFWGPNMRAAAERANAANKRAL